MYSKAKHLAKKSVMNMIWPQSLIMIGPSGLLVVISHLFLQFQFSFCGKVGKMLITKLGCEMFLHGHRLSIAGPALSESTIHPCSPSHSYILQEFKINLQDQLKRHLCLMHKTQIQEYCLGTFNRICLFGGTLNRLLTAASQKRS